MSYMSPSSFSAESVEAMAEALSEQQQKLGVRFGRINESNVQELRALNLAIFPVQYNDVFYADILRSPNGYATLGKRAVMHV